MTLALVICHVILQLCFSECPLSFLVSQTFVHSIKVKSLQIRSSFSRAFTKNKNKKCGTGEDSPSHTLNTINGSSSRWVVRNCGLACIAD